MGLVINTHQHISNEVEGRKYFPWRQSWHVCMDWAYAGWGGEHSKKRPPYTRDPAALYPKQGLRFADPSGEWTIKDMDDAGVDGSILLPIDYDYSWGAASDITIQEKHEHVAQMQQKYPGRFYGLAGPDPRRPGVDEIFGHAIQGLKLNGLKLIPKMGFYPWDERACRLYEQCLDYGVPVAVCTEPDGGGYNRDRFAQPAHLADVVADYPDLKLVMLHAGAPLYHWFEEALNVAARALNVHVSLDFWIEGFWPVPDFISNFRSDEESVVTLLSRVRDVLGAHRIMWGSDTFSGPGAHGDRVFGRAAQFGIAEVVAWLRDLPQVAEKYGKKFTPEEVELILGENAARVFQIKQYPEWERPDQYGWRRRSPMPFKSG